MQTHVVARILQAKISALYIIVYYLSFIVIYRLLLSFVLFLLSGKRSYIMSIFARDCSIFYQEIYFIFANIGNRLIYPMPAGEWYRGSIRLWVHNSPRLTRAVFQYENPRPSYENCHLKDKTVAIVLSLWRKYILTILTLSSAYLFDTCE